MATINVNGHTLDPVAQVAGGKQYVQDASQSNYILIHCHDHLQMQQYEELNRLHVETLEFLGENVYLCRYEPADLEVIRALPFIIYANIYHPDLVINARLKTKVLTDSQSRLSTLAAPETSSKRPSDQQPDQQPVHDVYIVLHPGSRPPAEVRIEVASLLQVDPSTIYIDSHSLRMKIRPEHLEMVSRLDEVRTIEEFPKIRTFATIAREGLHFIDRKDLSPPIDPNIYDADGETVIVTDTGFDKGSTEDNEIHEAFKGRVKAIIGVSRTTLYDQDGHGTHVAGCVAANGQSTQFGPVMGAAPKANLVIQVIDNGHGVLNIPEEAGLTSLFVTPYNSPDYVSRIHSNSWGGPSFEAYDRGATIVDEVVNNHKNYLILFAASNDGPDKNITIPVIGSFAGAKNVLTVGACESSRPLDYVLKPNVRHQKIYRYQTGKPNGNFQNVAWFSNPGPSQENRNKPDVIAPGCAILSARSQQQDLIWVKDTSGQSVYNLYGDSTDSKWIFSTGTSMATPLVAGCAAVLRKLLRSKQDNPPSAFPSAALMKALIINGTMDIQGVRPRGPSPIRAAPSPTQGFGLANIAATLRNVSDTSNGGYVEGRALKQTETFPQDINIPLAPFDPYKKTTRMPITLTVTMAYTDPAGVALMNELNLRVSASDGKSRYAGADPSKKDGLNNVQKLVWSDIPPGATKLQVHCDRITITATNTDQDFALAWYIQYGPPSKWWNLFLRYDVIVPSSVALAAVLAYYAL